MNVKGIIVEQIDWDGKSKSLTMQHDYRLGDLWVAFPTDYASPRTGPFYFQSSKYTKKYNSNFAECEARQVAKDDFYQRGNIFTFKTLYYNLPTENDALTYYALYLPEYAVPISVNLYDPQNSDKQYKRTVLKDEQKPRYIIYLQCSSRYGAFNFNLECQFRKDKQGFNLSSYSDEFQTDLYSNPKEWQRLMNETDKEKTQKFFAEQIVINSGTFEQTYKPSTSEPEVEGKKKFKLELGHKISLAGVIVAVAVWLWGNNILGRASSKEIPPTEIEISQTDSLVSADKKLVVGKIKKEVFTSYYKTIEILENKYASVSAIGYFDRYLEKEIPNIETKILNKSYIHRFSENENLWTTKDFDEVASLARAKTITRIKEIREEMENKAQGPFIFTDDKLRQLKESARNEIGE